jgi:hypothetical protein
VPIITGARRLEALEVYAHVMCGARVLTVEATSAIADVQDLFGKLENRTFVPHPAGLIDVVRAAREKEGPFLVVLVAATAIEGPTTVPVAPDIWNGVRVRLAKPQPSELVFFAAP